ncbi:MAG TPA: hypothetical protein V6C65_18845 [Allocoleopsis sp.]
MTYTLDQAGAFEFFGRVTLRPPNPSLPVMPYLLPFTIPDLLPQGRNVVAFGAKSLNVPARWKKAGNLVSMATDVEIIDTLLYEELFTVDRTELDFEFKYVPLNSINLYRFQQIQPQLSLRFDPVPWIREISLAVWIFRGDDIGEAAKYKTELLQAIANTQLNP